MWSLTFVGLFQCLYFRNIPFKISSWIQRGSDHPALPSRAKRRAWQNSKDEKPYCAIILCNKAHFFSSLIYYQSSQGPSDFSLNLNGGVPTPHWEPILSAVSSVFIPQTFSIQSITHLHVDMFYKQIPPGNKTSNKFKLFPTGINQTTDRLRGELLLIWAGCYVYAGYVFECPCEEIVSLFLLLPTLIGSADARSLTCTVAWQLYFPSI